MKTTPCVCDPSQDGYCERHRCFKVKRLRELCATDLRYYDQGERGDMPQQRDAQKLACIHRGDQVGMIDCQSCGGHVQVKLFACAKHGQCRLDRAEAGITFCGMCDDKDNGARKFIVHDSLSVGDIACLAGAVKAAKDSLGWKIEIDARTSCADIWNGAPFLTKLPDDGPTHFKADYSRGRYAAIDNSSGRPVHQVEAYCESLAREIGMPVAVKDWLEPAIILNDEEKSWNSQVQEITGKTGPFWIVNAGIKSDFTAKKWNGWQEVVDRTKDHVTWVQVGSEEHRHEALNGAIDMRGKTDLRQLVRLVYHASGVMCGVTGLMHLAHWVERGPLVPFRRHAVIISGGRESPSWFTYPGHHVFHTIGELDCCAQGGCWKSRVIPENDGDEKDSQICEHPRGHQGLCMEMIEPAIVARIILRLCK